MSQQINMPQYGNWVPKKLVTKSVAGSVLLALAAVARFLATPSVFGWRIVMVLGTMSAMSLICTAYFIEARHLFSYEGGRVQEKVTGRLLEYIDPLPDGATVLDIGCGSGALIVMLAKQFPGVCVTGIDSWSPAWEYSRMQCEQNAALEGVADQTVFLNASAMRLPFPDGSFDLVVSNMTFHEVRVCPDKRMAVREALRVVKKGGAFAFQDLFLLQRYFGTPDQLTAALKELGVQEVHFVPTGHSEIPILLRLPFLLGACGILYGTK